jgi:hypothetical protein
LPIWFQFLFLIQTVFYNPQAIEKSEVFFIDSTVSYTYGQQATFQVKIQSQEEIEELGLFIQAEGDSTHLVPLGPDHLPDQLGKFIYQHDLSTYPLRPFSRVNFWYRGKLNTGQEFTSDIYAFDYIDNRFSWEKMQSEQFSVYWYDDDLSLGQVLLNTAVKGKLSAQSLISTQSTITPIRIYLYASPTELQNALYLANTSWVAGHASPDLGIIMISAPPGPDQILELERQIPHEITHILQYQVTGPAYTQVPPWLIEGMASISELYPNPDYEQALNNAVDQNQLLPMNSYCQDFPGDSSGIFLAYAQSASFVRFLHSNYGASGMASLLEAYSNGLGCEEGVAAALDQSLSTLEAQWKQQTLGIYNGNLALNLLFPYGLLAVLILIPILVTTILKWPERKSNKEGHYE